MDNRRPVSWRRRPADCGAASWRREG